MKFSLFIKYVLKVNTIFFCNFLEVHFVLFALFPSNSSYNISLAGESLTHVIFFRLRQHHVMVCNPIRDDFIFMHFILWVRKKMNEGRLQCSYIRESAISFPPFVKSFIT